MHIRLEIKKNSNVSVMKIEPSTELEITHTWKWKIMLHMWWAKLIRSKWQVFIKNFKKCNLNFFNFFVKLEIA